MLLSSLFVTKRILTPNTPIPQAVEAGLFGALRSLRSVRVERADLKVKLQCKIKSKNYKNKL